MQRLGGRAPGTADRAQPDATAGQLQRPAWGAKAMHAPQQQPSGQATLAYDAADFVPASSSAWQADGGEWQGEDANKGYTKEEYDTWLQHGGYSQHADEEGYYQESEQDWYQPYEGDSGLLGDWDSQVKQQGRQQGGGSPGPDAEEALQQQLSGLHVDEASSRDERSEWLLMCEVRTPVLSGLCPPDSSFEQREPSHTPAACSGSRGCSLPHDSLREPCSLYSSAISVALGVVTYTLNSNTCRCAASLCWTQRTSSSARSTCGSAAHATSASPPAAPPTRSRCSRRTRLPALRSGSQAFGLHSHRDAGRRCACCLQCLDGVQSQH